LQPERFLVAEHRVAEKEVRTRQRFDGRPACQSLFFMMHWNGAEYCRNR
jgi:hypothetical protein